MNNHKYATNDDLIDKFLNDSRYEVLETGEIFRCHPDGSKKQRGYSNTAGYLVIRPWKHGPQLLVHRIIYRKFHASLDAYLVINHKDGNKLNNHKDNLEQITTQLNTLHSYRELHQQPIAGHRKINQNIANEIRTMHISGLTYKEILLIVGPKYGITSKGTISHIINNKNWTGKDMKLSKNPVVKTYNQKKFPKSVSETPLTAKVK